MTLSTTAVIETIGLVGTLILGGMKFGALDSRVQTLELRKDQSADVASIQTKVDDLSSDVKEMKNDVKKLLLRQLR